nr:deoxyuridine 5'-triphosphate nucleotidohydrolase [Paenibacillus elgii]
MARSLSVKIRKLHPDASVPTYATTGAAAFDLVAVEDVVIAPGETAKIPLGLAFEIPPGYVMYVCMRSGIALKTKLRQPNGIGVIDSDYRGEVAMLFENTAQKGTDAAWIAVLDGTVQRTVGEYPLGTIIIRKGDRVAQALVQPVPHVEFTVVDELRETDRGTGGFGSTGTKVTEN